MLLTNQGNQFAMEGLRTLCIGQRIISPGEFSNWNTRLKEASLHFKNAEQMEVLYDEMEVNLTLLGVTAVEDKLQDGVGDSIDNLIAAGIKIWLLTGDKLETAMSIGFASNLLPYGSELIVIDKVSKAQVFDQLSAALSKVATLVETNSKRIFSLVIEASCLFHIIGSVDLERLFIGVSKECKTVLCCRMSAKQKAEVVRLVKTNLQACCLAIGDGSNDVRFIISITPV